VRRLRSVSAAGISVVWVEFDWGQEIYRARQVVAERLQVIELPEDVDPPRLGPISSIMGEITFIALTSESVDPMELRRLAETAVRRRLLALRGISQVVPIGGEVRQFLVELDPAAVIEAGVSVEDVVAALRETSAVTAAGFHVDRKQEFVVRGLARARTTADLAMAIVPRRHGDPVRVGELGEVREAPAPRRGTASYRARPAVILSVQKQPDANTLELTQRIDRALDALELTLPEGVVIERENFRQADFIEVAVRNVSAALRDGAVLVVVVLFLFMGNVRSTLISAMAIGALVDDAIIDVENVLRRLKEERGKPAGERRPTLEVVFRASSEVRGAILFATLVVAVVFLPLLVLPGIEGRLLRPLGLAYLSSLIGSLGVALTVTPVLCALLLPRGDVLERREAHLLRWAKRAYAPTLEWSLAHPRVVTAVAAFAFAAAIAVVPFLGRTFLPPFSEGSATITLVSPPGTPLEDADALGTRVEEALLAVPEVVSTSRRTGRAEKDEHVQGVNASEMEVVLREGRPPEEVLAEMRASVAVIPGVVATFGQPIGHRIDHMISGSRTNLTIKIFGPDLSTLRALAAQAESRLSDLPDLVDLSNQEQASVPQLLVDLDRTALARYGLTPAAVAQSIEALFQGAEAGEIIEGGITSRVAVRFPPRIREDRERLAALPLTTQSGGLIPLGMTARLRFDLGPSLVRREDAQRVALLTANTAGADITGAVAAAREALAPLQLPSGYQVVFGGQFEEAARSLRDLALLSALVLVAMYGLLFLAFRDHRHTLIVLVNLPLALIGGVVAVAIGGGVLSVASLVGFVTLFGIATRNGVLLVSHYQALMAIEGASLREAVVRGSRERLAPVLMTALTAGLALVPLIVAGSAPGNQVQSPMAQVILGGLLSSTLLNLVIVPVWFARWGGGSARPPQPLVVS